MNVEVPVVREMDNQRILSVARGNDVRGAPHGIMVIVVDLDFPSRVESLADVVLRRKWTDILSENAKLPRPEDAAEIGQVKGVFGLLV